MLCGTSVWWPRCIIVNYFKKTKEKQNKSKFMLKIECLKSKIKFHPFNRG